MTWDPGGWVRPAGGGPNGDDGVAARLRAADDAAASALLVLVAADDVAWSTPAAAAYRAVLAEGADGVRTARVRLDAAMTAASRHDRAVAAAREAADREAADREVAEQALAWLLGGAG